METKILVADPTPLVRRGLIAILSNEQDIEVIAETDNAVETVYKTERLKPDIVLSELELPGGHISNVCTEILSKGLATRLVVLSMNCCGDCVSNAIAAGVDGYINKSASVATILEAVRRISAGQPVFSEEVQAAIQSYLQSQTHLSEFDADGNDMRPLLTEKELQVLQCIADGLSSEETSRRLHSSVSTIKNHRKSIFVKLNVPNAPGAVYEAMHRSLLQ